MIFLQTYGKEVHWTVQRGKEDDASRVDLAQLSSIVGRTMSAPTPTPRLTPVADGAEGTSGRRPVLYLQYPRR
jgi:hypothetical protein